MGGSERTTRGLL